ncbi:MAG: hypothetical protein MUF54_18755 [Polyangiaceae bacterium]|nr:hypothetical protein [Polyangiaceae bacterium]
MGRPRKIASSAVVVSPDALTSPLTGRQAAWLQVDVFAGDGLTEVRASASGAMRSQVRLGERLLVRTRRGAVALPMDRTCVHFVGAPQASAVLPEGAAPPAHPAFEQAWPAEGPVRCEERRVCHGAIVKLSAVVTPCTVLAPERAQPSRPGTYSSLAVLLFGVLLAVALYTSPMADRKDIQFVQRATGVAWPQQLTNVSVFDPGEQFMTAHVTLRSEDVERFRQGQRFSPCQPARGQGQRLDQLLLGVEQLATRFRTAAAGATLLCAEGKNSDNAWLYVLDPASGSVWVTLQYPNPANDPP